MIQILTQKKEVNLLSADVWTHYGVVSISLEQKKRAICACKESCFLSQPAVKYNKFLIKKKNRTGKNLMMRFIGEKK